jgi:hypothetical protein
MISLSLPTGYVNVFEGHREEGDISRGPPADANMISAEEFTELLGDDLYVTPFFGWCLGGSGEFPLTDRVLIPPLLRRYPQSATH